MQMPTHLYVKVIFSFIAIHARFSKGSTPSCSTGNFKSAVPPNKIRFFFIVGMNQASSFLFCDSEIY